MMYETRNDYLPGLNGNPRIVGAGKRTFPRFAAGAAAALGALTGCGVGGGGPAADTGAVTGAEAGGDGEMLVGGDGNDTLDNRLGARAIEAGGGDDTIIGATVAEAIRAGQGDDVVEGGAGDDVIDGGSGDDMINGGPGNDTMNGGAAGGADSGGFDTAVYESDWTGYRVSGERVAGEWAVFTVLDLEAGDGEVHEGEDELTGFEAIRFGSATLWVVETGTDSGEIVIGSADGSTEAALLGGAGDDIIFGFGGGDTIEGGAGGDVIAGGAGDDTLYGHDAEGAETDAEGVVDTAVFGGIQPGYTITAERGDFGVGGETANTVRLTVLDIHTGGSAVDDGRDTLIGFEALRFDGTSSSTTFNVTGAASGTGEILLGSDDADGTVDTPFDGMGGDDLIFGFGGDDVIDGGEGDDTIMGGDGNDTLGGGAGIRDTAVFRGDRRDYKITALLRDDGNPVRYGVEDGSPTKHGDDGVDVLTGIEELRFIGDDREARDGVPLEIAMADVVMGSSGNDVITEGGGGRRIFGGAGDDTIAGGGGGDIIEGGAGVDVAVFSGPLSDYTVDAFDPRSGRDGLIVKSGYSGILGYDGADTLSGIEMILFGAGTDAARTFTVRSDFPGVADNEILLGADRADSINAGGGDDIVFGFGGDDRINGGPGDDIVHGGAGADIMNGNGGNDVIFVETFIGDPDRVVFDNPLERYSFDVDGRGEIVVEDLGSADSGDHSGRNTVNLARDSETSDFATGILEFGDGESFLTDNVHIGEEIFENREYSDQSDIIGIRSYGEEMEISTGGGNDVVLITDETRLETSNTDISPIKIVDFEPGSDKIAFHPDLAVGAAGGGDLDVVHLTFGRGDFFFLGATRKLSIHIPNVPEDFDVNDLFYTIGDGAARGDSILPEEGTPSAENVVDGNDFETPEFGESRGKSEVKSFCVECDGSDSFDDSDVDPSPVTDDVHAFEEFGSQVVCAGGGPCFMDLAFQV